MPDKEAIEISRLQLERANAILNEIPVLIAHSAYETAVNRSYYAAFHALKALEALNGYSSKKHSGVIRQFCPIHQPLHSFGVRIRNFRRYLYFGAIFIRAYYPDSLFFKNYLTFFFVSRFRKTSRCQNC